MDTDTIVAIIYMLFVPINTYALYQAWNGDKVFRFLVCISLVLAFTDYDYKNRENSIVYGFIDGLKEEQQK